MSITASVFFCVHLIQKLAATKYIETDCKSQNLPTAA
mgnify:CR=1 FL=1